MTALQTEAVLACVNIVRNAVSTLQLHIMEMMIEDNREAHRKATDHDYYWMLRLRPNPEMTSHTFRSVAQTHMLLWGNAYIEIQRDIAARPIALWPRNPARTRPVRTTKDYRIEGTMYPAGTLMYYTSEVMGDEVSAIDDSENRSGKERIILAEDMLHMPGLSLDGRLGQSTVYLSRQIIGLNLAAEKSAAKLFGNGSVPRGIIELPGTLVGAALETFKRSWQEAYGGENQHKTAVLEKGVKFSPIGIDPEKSQLIQTREFQRKQIASIFNIPVHMIGEGSSSKSTVEQTSIEFLNLTIGPWLNVWEQELKVKLFPIDSKKQSPFFAKFDVRPLKYPDAESRSKYYQSARQNGWLSANDIRELEDLNPILKEDGGDVYYAPVNMVDASTGLLVGQDPNEAQVQPLQTKEPSNVQIEDENENQEQGAENPKNPKNKLQAPKQPSKDKKPTPPKSKRELVQLTLRYTRVYFPMFRDAVGRILKRDTIDENRFTRTFRPALYSLIEALADEFQPSGSDKLSARYFVKDVEGYLTGMRSNLIGTQPMMDETYAMREVRRAVEVFGQLVENRYNPNHHLQPRKGDGTWHDGKKPFYIGRHATTDDDINGRWSGWTSTPINDQGEKEIAATIEKIKALPVNERPKRIISSTLPRAQSTAQRYATALGIPMTTDWRLNSLDLGIFAGMNEKENEDRLQLYIDNPYMTIPGGETIAGYIKRSQEAIEDHRNQNEESGPILDLCHSSTIASYVGRIVSGKNDSEQLERSSEVLSPAGLLQFTGRKINVIAGTLNHGDAA